MRLLNTASLELTEFWDNEIPKYAILSHTWLKEEVSFQDMQNGNAENKAGYAKIMGSCRRARLDNWSYLWIDTCCIDKNSSSELTEAINSMYRWYENAQICYVYLSDVDRTSDAKLQNQAFARSRWFTRGWTLQELIAPALVEFYSRDWERLGQKSELKNQISIITGIATTYLEHRNMIQDASVARKMSWASRRVTTRVEDMAYCMLGLFEINMPLLYGEGQKAFIRLQEEIIKTSNDHSIFAWTHEKGRSQAGMFADSPRCFSKSRNIVGAVVPANTIPAITNCGLRLELVLVPPRAAPGHDANLFTERIAILNCVDTTSPGRPIGIRLDRYSFQGFSFLRIQTHLLFTVDRLDLVYKGITLKSEVIYVQDLLSRRLSASFPYEIDPSDSESKGSFSILNVHPLDMWTPYKSIQKG